MNSDESKLDGRDRDEAELVAYLDGELDAELSARVERRLSEDTQYRLRLQQLQQTWDMLDFLPRRTVSEKFTQSTVEMVAVKATGDVEQAEAELARRRRRRRLAGGVAAAVAALAGYFLISGLASRADNRLLQDLPVIQNIDVYRHAESIDFLRQLDEQGLFDEEADDDL